MKILVTGAAGFIGFHVVRRLLEGGHSIVAVDNLNPYYSVELKRARRDLLKKEVNCGFWEMDLAQRRAVEDLFSGNEFDRVVHLAAQPGVRFSLENPHAYVESNIVAFLHVLEGCRHARVPHLVYASSSSVYGSNKAMPLSVHQSVDHPISLYAATKKSNELMAHVYSHLFGLPTTGLRFFTVYGPWGRPDMAAWLFTKSILDGKPIELFNDGAMKRDFTYVDDVVSAVVALIDKIPVHRPDWDAKHPDPSTSAAPYRVLNVGNHSPIELRRFVASIERATGKRAVVTGRPLHQGDVLETYADVTELERLVGFVPKTGIDDGVEKFVHWFKEWNA
ncbi:MAG: NAD-dependent epimerase/dehydratase family protein [Bdellovibrionales bacterium]|nr:NAD-dependent epimerase/dehydratase family protein [Bdellovibrionales bacterium]